MCFGPILHQKSKNVNFVKVGQFPSHRVRTANRAHGCQDFGRKSIFCTKLRSESWLEVVSDAFHMSFFENLGLKTPTGASEC